MDIISFFHQHQFLAWCALWGIWPVSWVAVAICSFIFKLVNRVLRTIKVLCRGWPPEHLDADGDFRVLPKPNKNNPEEGQS